MHALRLFSLSPVRNARGLFAMVTAGHCVAMASITLLIAMALFVLKYGVNLPMQDEWDAAGLLLHCGYGWDWITQRHNEHRFWFGRLFWGLGMVASGYDFRVGGWITLAMLAGSTLWLLRTAARVRGRTTLTDLLVPALLLNVGHGFNLVMGYQVVFAATMLCGCGLLVTAMQSRAGSEFRTGVFATVWMALMAGNGGFGTGFAPPIAMWIVFLAWCCRGDLRKAALLVAGPGLVLAYVVWNHLALSGTSSYSASLESILKVAGEYLGIGLGSMMADILVAATVWLPVLTVLVVLVHVLAVSRLVWVFVRCPEERPRAAGLLAVLGGHFCVALGIAMSRESALAVRYVTPSAIGLLACWATAVCFGPRTWRSTGTTLAAIAAVGIAVSNAPHVRQYLTLVIMHGPRKLIERDIQSGMPPTFLTGKYGHSLSVLIGERVSHYFNKFHDAGLRPFRDMATDPAMRSVPLFEIIFPCPMPSSATDQNRPGPMPQALPLSAPSGHIHGLRVAFAQDVIEGYQVFLLHWKDGEGRERRELAFGPFYVGRGTVAFWINGPATDVRLERRGAGHGPMLTAAEWLVPGFGP